jgi:hypothetical protein
LVYYSGQFMAPTDEHRPNCPHCGVAMSILRRGVRGDLVSYLCPWHGRFWLDNGQELRTDTRSDEPPQKPLEG